MYLGAFKGGGERAREMSREKLCVPLWDTLHPRAWEDQSIWKIQRMQLKSHIQADA